MSISHPQGPFAWTVDYINIDVQTSGAVQWGRLANGFGLPRSYQAASLIEENGAKLL
jgi:hypothetical protein